MGSGACPRFPVHDASCSRPCSPFTALVAVAVLFPFTALKVVAVLVLFTALKVVAVLVLFTALVVVAVLVLSTALVAVAVLVQLAPSSAGLFLQLLELAKSPRARAVFGNA